MKPLSALYYIKENKQRAFILIFMLLLTTFLFLAGNYIDSVYYFWDRSMEYSEKVTLVNAMSTDEDFKEFAEIYRDLKEDENLVVMPRSPRGFTGLDWVCTMGYEMGSASYVFNTAEDMKKTFEKLGIECDFADIKDKSVVVSSALARQYSLKKGDIIDSSVDEGINGSYTLDAIIEDDSFILFYVCSYEGVPVRLNVMAKGDMSGAELRNYVKGVIGDRKGFVDISLKDEISRQFEPFFYIFYGGTVLVAIVLAVIVNSVISGQYIRRTFEFGVYRAIGMSKAGVYKKCAAEILTMDFIAVVLGAVMILLYTFMVNEMVYIPAGKYLPYYSGLGIGGFLITNVLVVISAVLLRGRSMSRADVTEF